MKVTPQDLEKIRAEIAPHDTEEQRAKYRRREFARADAVKDLDKRYRWDLYWHAARVAGGLPDSTNGYSMDHIDTALRNIVPPLGEK